MYDLKKKTSLFLSYLSLSLFNFGFVFHFGQLHLLLFFYHGNLRFDFCFCGGEMETLDYVRYGITLHDVVLWNLQTKSGYAA
jgi:hypothetical protein